jgi:hypothetical protein
LIKFFFIGLLLLATDAEGLSVVLNPQQQRPCRIEIRPNSPGLRRIGEINAHLRRQVHEVGQSARLLDRTHPQIAQIICGNLWMTHPTHGYLFSLSPACKSIRVLLNLVNGMPLMGEVS